MFIVLMRDDKSLHLTTKSNNYKGENNVEQILFLIPQIYNDVNLANCNITLHWINQDLTGDVMEIQLSDELYKDKYYQAIIPITSEHTFKEGDIELWLEAIDFTNDFVLKTSTVKIPILDHKHIVDYIADNQIELFESYVARMDELLTTANDVNVNTKNIEQHIEQMKLNVEDAVLNNTPLFTVRDSTTGKTYKLNILVNNGNVTMGLQEI